MTTLFSDGVTACLQITLPEASRRTPVDIVAVVDVSGSMGGSADITTANGRESNGFSSLNIVQHAVRTVIASLTPADQFALVSFHSTTKTEFPLTPVKDAGVKAAADAAVNALYPQNNTNLWAGLERAFSLLPTDTARMPVILILTDGVENETPAEGTVAACKSRLDRLRATGASVPLIYTLGFGTNLESPKLVDLAAASPGGLFEYTHDAGSVGTVFVNALANIFVTAAREARVVFSNQTEILLGALYAGQTKSTLFPASSLPNAMLFYQSLTGEARAVPLATVPTGGAVVPPREAARHALIGVLEKALLVATYSVGQAKDLFPPLLQSLGVYRDLFQDAVECLKALSFTHSWGLHFIRGMRQNHFQQVCAHFKDVGTEGYTSRFRSAVAGELNTIFNSLPAQKPSLATQATIHVASMASYNSCDDPCMAGWCRTLLANGQWCRLDNLQKGDQLRSGARIECVVKTRTRDGHAALVHLPKKGGNGLWITPYHPIRTTPVAIRRVTPRLHRTLVPAAKGSKGSKGARSTWTRSRNVLAYKPAVWNFPCELNPVVLQPCPAVYSFVLDTRHTMEIEGFTCVTLGHGFGESKVAHPYLGTDAVIRDLAQMPGFDEGLLEFHTGCLARDPQTGLLNGFNPAFLC